MVAFGGCLPFMIQALSMAIQPGFVAAGVMLIILAVVAFCACLAVIKHAPVTNARGGNDNMLGGAAVGGAHNV
jgi:anaerobic C4-dicarboxylate transporter